MELSDPEDTVHRGADCIRVATSGDGHSSSVLLEPEHLDAVHSTAQICELRLNIADGDQLSPARALELDHLSWTAGSELEPGLSAEGFLNNWIQSFKS